MHPATSLLESKGLTSIDRIDDVIFRRWSLTEIERLNEELYGVVDSLEEEIRNSIAEEDPLGEFNFVASLSLSGAAGCIEPHCRARRAETLGRYAALYADRVIAPMPLVNPVQYKRPKTPEDEVSLRLLTVGTILSIHAMRPALDAGMVELIIPVLHFCPNCNADALGRMDRISAAALRLANANRRQFSAVYEGPSPFPRVTVHGPSEYCEHEEFGRLYYHVPAWLPKSYVKRNQVRLSAALLRKSKIVDELFRKISSQVTLQEFLGFRYNAKTVTTNPGELALLSQLDPAQGIHKKATASLAWIAHVIPMMEGVSLASAVRVRREEGDAFLVYRKALTQALGEVMKVGTALSEKQAQEIVSHILRPEVAKLRVVEASERRRAKTRAV
jgi:hypothetical protein